MRKEFEALHDVLFNGNTYDNEGNCNYNEVNNLLTALENKIIEVEKRMDAATRSAKEITDTITVYENAVDDGLPFTMSVPHFDTIKNSSDDVRIALDLNDDMSIADNWYNLFPKKNRPIVYAFGSSHGTMYADADGNVISVEHDDPSDSDNYLRKIVRFDIASYEKILKRCNRKNYAKMEGGEDILYIGYWSEGDKYDAPSEEHIKSVYGEVVNDDDETYPIVNCSHCGHAQPLLDENIKVDVVTDGKYFRCEDCDGTTDILDETPIPTVLCMDENKHNRVKIIITMLKDIEVDGETMEYILRKVGMEEQMLRQLVMGSPYTDTSDLLAEKVELDNQMVGPAK